MKLNKIEIAPNQFGPDTPEGLAFKSVTYRPETDDYWGEFQDGENPNEITALQGEQYLNSITINGQNGLEVVMGAINAQPNLLVKRFFEKATVWKKDTQAIKDMCTAFGLDINTVFSEAKKFDRFLK